MNIEEIRRVLQEIEITTFSKHFHDEKVKLRGITQEEIKANFQSLDKLIAVEDQGKEPK